MWKLVKVVCFAFLFLAIHSWAGVSDPDATEETQKLYRILKSLMGRSFVFGHQNAVIEGRGWHLDGVSDVKQVSGDYPAMYGFDFRPILLEASTYWAFSREKVKEIHRRGGVATFSWHMYNPLTGGNFYDKTPALHTVLPGGQKHDYYKKRLDYVASFFLSLKDDQGKLIPVIFRPFHEHDGHWFWWSYSRYKEAADNSLFLSRFYRHLEEKEFVKVWRFTVNYLRKKGVHNLLIAWSPGEFHNEEEYLLKWPGRRYVDILAMDKYADDISKILPKVRVVVKSAKRMGKIAAIAETGHEGIGSRDYWTKNFLIPLKKDPVARNVAYVMFWRNSHSSQTHFYVPYPGHPSETSFREMADDSFVLFEKDLARFRSP